MALISDGENIGLLLAGMDSPRLFDASQTILRIDPIRAVRKDSDDGADERVRYVLEAARVDALEDAPQWPASAEGESYRLVARALGFVKRGPMLGPWRWTEAARFYAQACALPDMDEFHRSGAMQVVQYIDNRTLIIGDQSIDLNDLADLISVRMEGPLAERLADEVRDAVARNSEEDVRESLRKVGRDVIVGVLGNAVWRWVSGG